MAASLLDDVRQLDVTTMKKDDYLLEIAKAINHHFPNYNWVGFYFLKDGRLHIGPYIGAPTPHTVIDLDKGICGAAVSQGETVVVDDVNADPRFLACSLTTKSEIVIPIRINGEIIGELDIDSDTLSAFSNDDRVQLEAAVVYLEAQLPYYLS